MEIRRRNVFDDHFAIGETTRRFAIAHHPHVLIAPVAVGIRKIQPVIRSKLRMQRDAHQSALALRIHVRHGEQRRRAQLSVLKHSHASGPLGKDHPAIGRPNDRPGHFQIANDRLNLEAGLRTG